MKSREHLGRFLGYLLSPIAYLGSRLRRASVVHPSGLVFSAVLEPFPALKGSDAALAQRLAGEALVRLSATFWKHQLHWSDGLGCSIRLRAIARDGLGEQDLIFATVRSVFTLPFAPFTTNVEDFLDNDYYAGLPFAVDDWGRAHMRLVSLRSSSRGQDRVDRIRRRAREKTAVLVLQFRNDDAMKSEWRSIARLRLLEEIETNPPVLKFSPFRDGRGIHPEGFINAIRGPIYEASQRGRRGELSPHVGVALLESESDLRLPRSAEPRGPQSRSQAHPESHPESHPEPPKTPPEAPPP